MVTGSIKRRTANRQAVNRKAEVIEPRNAYFEKDDTLGMVEVYMGIPVNDKAIPASLGSESMACLILGLHGNMATWETLRLF